MKTSVAPPDSTVRLPDVHPDEASAFLGRHKRYDYTVSHEEFDRYDNEGPGHYVGVIVEMGRAEGYRAALRECQAASLDPLGLKGLALRLKASGLRPNAAYRALAERAEQRLSAVERQQAIDAEYESLILGHTSIGADAYSAEHWQEKKFASLPELFHDRIGSSQFRKEVRRLPNGDLIIVTERKSWARWTTDETLIADHGLRCSVVGYRHHPDVGELVVEGVRNGALRGVYCWLGGTAMIRNFVEDGYLKRNYGCGEPDASRYEQTFRDFIEEVSSYHRTEEQKVTLGTLRTLTVQGGWITVVMGK